VNDMPTYQGRFFAAVGHEFVQDIQTAGAVQRFKPGERLPVADGFRRDEQILVLRTGFAAVAATGASRETLLSIRGPGDVIGEWVLLGGQNSSREAWGLTDVTAWLVRLNEFRMILQRCPSGWEVLARDLHERLEAAEARISTMAGENASRRLAAFLLQLLSYEEQPGDRQVRHLTPQMIPLPLSQAQLGAWIGVSRETIERILAEWTRRGTVRTGRRRLYVHDIEALERLAGVRSSASAQTA
jgi:CRP/FNR family cyclic AMP-dependent transcriptional regulator